MPEHKQRQVMDIIAPVQTPVIPVKAKPTWKKLMHRLPRIHLRSSRVYVVAAGVVVCAVGVYAFIHFNDGPIPSKYRHGISFPLYYPNDLPAGYAVERSTFVQPKSGVLEFAVRTPEGKNVAVSEERIPLGVDLNPPAEPSGVQLPDIHTFTTGIGPAQISFWGSNYVCSIVAAKTWLIMNVSGVPSTEATIIAQSFQPI